MFVFNGLPCEFQVKKLYRPRKFTCLSTPQAAPQTTGQITPKSAGSGISDCYSSLADISDVRAASAAPFKAFRLPGATTSTCRYAVSASFGRFISMSRSPSNSRAGRMAPGVTGVFFRGIFVISRHSKQTKSVIGSMLCKRHPSSGFVALNRHLFRPVNVAFSS